MDIVTLAAARKSGGSGGDVTKKYVDDHLALKADKIETAEYPIADRVSGDAISVTGTADANVQKLTIYGRSEVVEGEIVSIGDGGSITITTSNSDSTASSAATLTTGLPLRGIPVNTDETYTDGDGVKWAADSVSTDGVVKRCYKLVLTGDESWSANPNSTTGTSGSKRIYCDVSAPLPNNGSSEIIPSIICNSLKASSPTNIYNKDEDNVIASYNYTNTTTRIYIRISGIASASNLKTYLNANPVTIVYILKTPIDINLNPAEKSAILNLKTFDGTTNLSITDDPFVDFGYLKNTENGKAIAQEEANTNSKINLLDAAHLALIADEYDSTATYAQRDYCIYSGKLYKCTTAVSTAEAFDPEKWTATTIMAEIEGG